MTKCSGRKKKWRWLNNVGVGYGLEWITEGRKCTIILFWTSSEIGREEVNSDLLEILGFSADLLVKFWIFFAGQRGEEAA